MERINKIVKSWSRVIKKNKIKRQTLNQIWHEKEDYITDTMEITKNHKRLQKTTISQQNLESEIHGQMHRKSSKKKQKIWAQQLQALI